LRDRGFKKERKSLKPTKRDRGFLKKQIMKKRLVRVLSKRGTEDCKN
jgi:hypothetical protein